MTRELTCYKCVCYKCQHTWTTKGHKLPKVCPKCHRKSWNDDATVFENVTFTKPLFGELVTPKESPLLDVPMNDGAPPVEETSRIKRPMMFENMNPEWIDLTLGLSENNWQFTKERPQYADDGNVYRQQALAPHFKRFRTVRVSEDDNETIV